MTSMREVLLTTDTNNSFANVLVWDLESGSTRNLYKNGTSAPNTLNLLGDRYLVSALLGKPVIQLWEAHKRDQLCLNSVVPGVITALAVSPDGHVCVGGIEDKIFVWLTATGQLKAILKRHYQPISALKFTDDGCMFVSGGSDSLVIAWSTADALAGSYEAGGDEAAVPEHVWSDHSLPVTGLAVGKGGTRARVFTSSLDQSCKVFDLVTGQILLSVIFDVRVLCVAVDPVESAVFAGGQDGSVFIVNLRSPPRTLEYHMSEEERRSSCLLGHTKAITCLATTMDGTTVVSGSEDATVRVWSVASRQCLRTLPHKGSVTNVSVVLPPRGMIDPDSAKPKRSRPVAQLKRSKGEDADQVLGATFPIWPRASLRPQLRQFSRILGSEVDEEGDEEVNGLSDENEVDEVEEEKTAVAPEKAARLASRARYQSSVLGLLE